MDRTAVLVIDLQNEIGHPDGKLAKWRPVDADRMLESVRRLVTWAHNGDVPVIWARLAFRPGHYDAVRDSMSRRLGSLVDGTWGADLLDGLGRRDDDIVITKKRPSAFFSTDLTVVLRGLEIQRLIVCGASTNWAVESTVRDAHSHDYRVVVASDATGSALADLHESSLKSMAAVFADVRTVDEIVAGLPDRPEAGA
jgi:nicotinamidase-related amidase